MSIRYCVRTSVSHPSHAPVEPPSVSPGAANNPNCSICLTEPRDTALLCGHQLCWDCAQKVDSCPVCRKFVTHRIRLFQWHFRNCKSVVVYIIYSSFVWCPMLHVCTYYVMFTVIVHCTKSRICHKTFGIFPFTHSLYIVCTLYDDSPAMICPNSSWAFNITLGACAEGLRYLCVRPKSV